MRNRFFQILKGWCPRGSDRFSLLMEGYIVVLLRGKPLHSAIIDFFGEDEGLDDASDDIVWFWHVSHIHLSPWRPAFQDMACDDIVDGTVPLRRMFPLSWKLYSLCAAPIVCGIVPLSECR